MRITQRKINILIAIFVIIITTIFFFSSLKTENLTYYFRIHEVRAEPTKFMNENIRVMGLVEKGSVTWEPAETKLNFRITENNQEFLTIFYIGAKPDMFREGQGIVVEGTLKDSQNFYAKTLLVKHSEEYQVDEHKKGKKLYYESLIKTSQ